MEPDEFDYKESTTYKFIADELQMNCDALGITLTTEEREDLIDDIINDDYIWQGFNETLVEKIQGRNNNESTTI